MTIDEICEAVVAMTPAERSHIRLLLNAMAEADEDAWDRQIEEDAKSGRLDKLTDEASAEFRARRSGES